MVLFQPDNFVHVDLPNKELTVEYLVPGLGISRMRRILPVLLHFFSKQAPHQGMPATTFIFLSLEVSDR